MDVLFSNNKFCVIHKDAGDHIHPPENGRIKIPKNNILIYKLRDYFYKKIYPVHRLDAGTEGLVVFAFDPETANYFQCCIQNQKLKKTYKALIRGHLNLNYLKNQSVITIEKDSLTINMPLESDSTGILRPAISKLKILNTFSTNDKVGKRNQLCQMSLIQLEPITGRYHQLRRHLNRISHPIVGDRTHGDCHYNKYSNHNLNIHGLCLWATQLQLPWEGSTMNFEISKSDRLDSIEDLFSKSQS